MDLRRVALVTGANRGMGFEAVRQLAERGHTVILAGRDEDDAKEAAGELQSEGLDAHAHRLDVTDDEQVLTIRDEIQNAFGRCDVLVNNAGVLHGDAATSVLDDTSEALATSLDVHVVGAFRLCRAFAPMLRANGCGRIVNVSSRLASTPSLAAHHHDGRWAAFRISKAALHALTQLLAAEFTDGRVLVNAVCPGWVRTDLGGVGADRSIADGVDTTVWLATLPDDGPTGGLFRDRTLLSW